MIIRFYVSNTKWYADIPRWVEEGGDIEELQMVSGADTWLDWLSNYTDTVTLEIDTVPFTGCNSKLMYIGDIDMEPGNYMVYPGGFELWLCQVVTWLFGEYPNFIYYKTV